MKYVLWVFIFIFVTGCAAAPKVQRPGQPAHDAASSLEALAGSLAGKEVSQEDLKNLARDMQNDPETQGAVQAVTGALTKENAVVYYCPVDGKRFSPQIKLCPEHQVELKVVE